MPRLLAEIAYGRALHALSQQEAALNELRSRTGTLLAAEALTTSFLGAAAVQHGALALPGRLAITCFAFSLGAALFVLLPWRGLQFSLTGSLLPRHSCSNSCSGRSPSRTSYDRWSCIMTVMEHKTTLDPPPGPPPPGLGHPEIIWPWVKFIERRRAARKAAAEAKEREDDAGEDQQAADGD